MLFAGAGAGDAAASALAVTGAEPDLETVLDAVLRSGLARVPALFIGELHDDRLTAVVRGDIAVEVETTDRTRHDLSGVGVRTWREFSFSDVARLRVGNVDAGAPPLQAYVGRLNVGGLVWQATAAPPDRAPAHRRPAASPALDPALTLDFVDGDIAGLSAPATSVVPVTGPEDGAVPAAPPVAGGPLTGVPASVAPPTAPPAADISLEQVYGETIRYSSPPGTMRPAELVDESLDESSAALTGVVCPAGHGNPLEREVCARCGAPLRGAALRRVARPDLGMLSLPDGTRHQLRGVMLIGRSPRGDRAAGADVPTLITVDDKDVSRTHARVRTEGWQVLVEDLGSTNGTTLTPPGGSPRRIRTGEPALVSDGAVIELGTQTRITFTGVP